MSNNVPFLFWLSVKQKQLLKQEAKVNNISAAEYLRRVLLHDAKKEVIFQQISLIITQLQKKIIKQQVDIEVQDNLLELNKLLSKIGAKIK